MAIEYLKSENIKVFPSAYRKQNIDTSSKYTTERNLTSSIQNTNDIKCYIVSYDEATQTLILNMLGYMFTINDFEIPDGDYYVGIRLAQDNSDNSGNYGDRLAPYNSGLSQDILDSVLEGSEEEKFLGLAFSADKSELDGATATLQIVKDGEIYSNAFAKQSYDKILAGDHLLSESFSKADDGTLIAKNASMAQYALRDINRQEIVKVYATKENLDDVVSGIQSGSTVVGKAINDSAGNNILATYGSSLDTYNDGAGVILKNKNGQELSRLLVDNVNNATNATNYITDSHMQAKISDTFKNLSNELYDLETTVDNIYYNFYIHNVKLTMTDDSAGNLVIRFTILNIKKDLITAEYLKKHAFSCSATGHINNNAIYGIRCDKEYIILEYIHTTSETFKSIDDLTVEDTALQITAY